MKKLIALLSLLFSISSFAQIEELGQMSSSFSVEHYMGFYEDVESQSRAYLFLRRGINDKTRFEILQGVSKLYTVNPGEPEVLFTDSILYLHHRLHKNLALRFSGTIPLSQRSQDNGRVSNLMARLSFQGMFLDNKLFMGYRPYATYAINKYTADREGNLMTKYSIGNSLLLAYQATDKISVGGIIAAGISFQEQSALQPNAETSDNGFYSFDLFASYNLTQNLALRAGYSQGDAQLREGVREMYFFDQYNSLYYVGTDILF